MTALRRIARLEHRLTRPDASLGDLDAALRIVREHELATLTVTPWLVRPAVRMGLPAGVRLAAVIGYPHGGQVSAVKAFEASRALEDGATELDFVINAGSLLSGDEAAALADMQAVIEMAHSALARCGAIVQPGRLGDDIVVRAGRLAARAGVDHLVTSSGEEPASVAIGLTSILHRLSGDHEVKAAGIFTTLAEITEAFAAGAAGVSASLSPELAAEADAWLREPILAEVAG
jgi:deoxyribose-phosphate aldolase